MKYLKTASGAELTPEYEAELVAEAEAGYEGREGRIVLVGRPPLSDSGPSRRLQARVPKELGDEVERVAKARESTISEVVREALERFVDEAA